MWKHNLIISLRGIVKDKGYSLINIVGLAIAIACSFLFIFWVKFELSYEHCYPKGNRIYRLMDLEERTSGPYYSLWLPYSLEGFKEKFPQVEAITAFSSFDLTIVEYGKEDSEGISVKGAYAAEDFLRMFAYEYLEGTPQSVAKNRGVILSEKAAHGLFGNEPARGKTIRFVGYTGVALRIVDAVVKIPENSELQFDCLELLYTSAGSGGLFRYVMLGEGEKLTPELKAMIEDYPSTVPRSQSMTDKLAESSRLIMQPLYETHLHSPDDLVLNINARYTDGGDLNQLYIFSVVALLILFIAIINYVNTSIARSLTRMKEVGVRKVTGASKGQLVGRFLFESFVITFIAVILSLVLVKILFPYFSEVMGNRISLVFDFPTILIAVAVCLIVSLLSGAYAAFYLSNFSPSLAFRGGSTIGSKERLRKMLLGVQFFLAVSILVCTSVIYKQISSILNNKNGMDRENVLYLRAGLNNDNFIDAITAENPDIISATAAHAPPYSITRGYTGVTWTGSSEESKNMEFGQVYSDHYYADVWGLEILEGEFLPPGRGRSAGEVMDEQGFREVVVNETFKKLMGEDNPIGMYINNEGGNAKIVGVVKDFSFKPIREPIQPLMIAYEPQAMFIVYVKTTGRDNKATMEYLLSKYKDMAGRDPSFFGTVDEDYRALYKSELRTGSIMAILSGIALFLSLLGVMSMVSFILEKRTKEIAIRKINGATIADIIKLFSVDIVRIALIASVVSIPICYMVMSRWLEAYVFRITLSWWIFAAVPVCIIAVTVAIIAAQVYNTARRNPVESLRSE